MRCLGRSCPSPKRVDGSRPLPILGSGTERCLTPYANRPSSTTGMCRKRRSVMITAASLGEWSGRSVSYRPGICGFTGGS